MSDRYSSEAGRVIAAALRTVLEPCCERIEVVGSLRRNCPTVGDVELLYGVGVTVRETGEVIPARSERDVFNLCDVPYLPPEAR